MYIICCHSFEPGTLRLSCHINASAGVAKGRGGANLIATNDKNNDNNAFFQLKFILALLRSTKDLLLVDV